MSPKRPPDASSSSLDVSATESCVLSDGQSVHESKAGFTSAAGSSPELTRMEKLQIQRDAQKRSRHGNGH
ncbi:MAG TPA: hypothetical protein VI913_01695 [Candidatus Peribacteraceae bacterium]|nr:hypothetical protein [Candidatus Peribacteraceae bacterium]